MKKFKLGLFVAAIIGIIVAVFVQQALCVTIGTSNATEYSEVSRYAALQTAVATIGSLKQEIVIDGNVNACVSSSATYTIPANISVKIRENGVLTIPATCSVFIQGNVSGPGRINGHILLYGSHQKIDGVQFISSPTNSYAVNLRNTVHALITNNTFSNYTYAVFAEDYGIVSEKDILSNNTYTAVDYFFINDATETNIVDITINNNVGVSKISHFNLSYVDGLTMYGNTLFSYNNASSAHGIFFNMVNNIIVSNNKIFESGNNGLLCGACSYATIADNQFFWTGQLIESAAIEFTDIPIAGAYYTFAFIHDNLIRSSSGHGIYIAAPQGRVNLHNNIIFSPGSSERYYGAPLSGTAYGIYNDADTVHISVHDNNVISGINSISQGGSSQNKIYSQITDSSGGGAPYVYSYPSIATITTGTNTDVSNFDQINFSHSAPTNFSAFVMNINGDYLIKNFTARFYNGNTTLVNSAGLVLKGGTNVTPAANSVITFQIYSVTGTSYAIETGRNF